MANADGTSFFTYDVNNTFSEYRRTAASGYGHLIDPERILKSASEYALTIGLNYLHTPAVGVISSNYFFDFYQRIWIIPPFFNLTNPRRNSPIPFHIWNAFTTSLTNSLTTDTITGSPGMTVDVPIPSSFKAVEYRLVNLSLGAATPNVAATNFVFAFAQGSAPLLVNARLATVLSVPPEVPITETWDWLSDVFTSFNGTEQRVALRGAPSRTIKYITKVLGTQDYQQQVRTLWEAAQSVYLIPFFQYATSLTQEAPVGASTIFIDPKTTDLQVGDNVFLYGRNGQGTFKLLALTATNFTIDSPLTFDMPVGDMVIPAFGCYLPDKTAIKMKGYQNGQIDISGTTANSPHTSHSRPGSATVFNALNNLIILDKQPLGDKDDDFAVMTGGDMIDYKIGVNELYTTWLNNKFMGSRQYKISRYSRAVDMDYWRDFGAYCSGQQSAFLMPTFRPDLTLGPVPPLGGTQIVLGDTDYSRVFFSSSTIFGYIGIQTANGWFYTRVLGASIDAVTGNDALSISPGLPFAPGSNIFIKICLVIRCRLATDKITLTHNHLSTVVDIMVRSTEQ